MRCASWAAMLCRGGWEGREVGRTADLRRYAGPVAEIGALDALRWGYAVVALRSSCSMLFDGGECDSPLRRGSAESSLMLYAAVALRSSLMLSDTPRSSMRWGESYSPAAIFRSDLHRQPS